MPSVVPPSLPRPALSPSAPATDDVRVAQHINALREWADIGQSPLKSHRKVFGYLVIVAKKFVRQLMTPVLERQAAYNAVNIQALEALESHARGAARREAVALKEELGQRLAELDQRTLALEELQLEELQKVQEDVRQRVTELDQRTLALQALVEDVRQRVTELTQRTDEVSQRLTERDQRTLALQEDVGQHVTARAPRTGEVSQRLTELDPRTAPLPAEMSQVLTAFQATREQVARAERKLRRILYTLSPPSPPSAAVERPHSRAALGNTEWLSGSEFDYAGFEERFRGSEAEIKQNQRRYLPAVDGHGPILDIGCGRGEFLECLRESGIEARGVDLNLDMVLLCREKGLDVSHEEAFDHLAKVADGSLGGIFSSQFIEHFPPNDVIRLIGVCYHKLKPGGVLIFETVNPKCLTVFARSFFLDPSHVWPFHPETLRFMLETRGFTDIVLEFFSPVEPVTKLPYLNVSGSGPDASLDAGIDLINELLFGDQDYAITARKGLVEASA